MIKTFFSSVVVGISVFFGVLVPLYRTIITLRNQILGNVFGIPPWLVGVLFLIPVVFKIGKKFFKDF